MLAPVLMTVDNDTPLIVGTDAGAKGLAAYLAQFRTTQDASGQTMRHLHPIAFASRRNLIPEHKEHSFKLELKGIKWALEKFHKFVWGHQIILKTDCKAVKDLLSNKSLPPTHARYKEVILAYNIIDFIHQEGKTNPADGLSRSGLPSGPPAPRSTDAGWESRLGIINDLYLMHRTPLHLLVPDQATENLLEQFSKDADMTTILKWLLFLELAENLTKRERDMVKKRANEYFIARGKLWKLRKGASHSVECLSREEGLAIVLKI
jgi:RNase H-like domain found in reverse transcriptase